MKKVLLVLVFCIVCVGLASAISVSPTQIKSAIVVGDNKGVSLDFSCEGECSLFSQGGFFELSSYSGEGEFSVDVNFNNLSEGVYVGSISVEEVVVPIVLEVNSPNSDIIVTLDVSSADKKVAYLSEMFPKINFHNLKQTVKDIDVEFFISDMGGEVLYSEKNTFSLSDKYSYSEAIPLSSQVLPGRYVFSVVVESEDKTAVSSYFFSVIEEDDSGFELGDGFFVVVILILIIMVGVVVYMLYERRNYLGKLTRRHKSELKYYSKKIQEEEIESLARAKTNKEKEKVKREFADAKRKILGEMRKRHRSQTEELKKMKLKKVGFSEKSMSKFNHDVYNKALRSAAISAGLKNKLSVLKRAHREGIISKDSLEKSKTRIDSANRKLKRNVYK